MGSLGLVVFTVGFPCLFIGMFCYFAFKYIVTEDEYDADRRRYEQHISNKQESFMNKLLDEPPRPN